MLSPTLDAALTAFDILLPALDSLARLPENLDEPLPENLLEPAADPALRFGRYGDVSSTANRIFRLCSLSKYGLSFGFGFDGGTGRIGMLLWL